MGFKINVIIYKVVIYNSTPVSLIRFGLVIKIRSILEKNPLVG